MIGSTKILFVAVFGILLTLFQWESLRQQNLKVMVLRLLVLNIPILLFINLLLLGEK